MAFSKGLENGRLVLRGLEQGLERRGLTEHLFSEGLSVPERCLLILAHNREVQDLVAEVLDRERVWFSEPDEKGFVLASSRGYLRFLELKDVIQRKGLVEVTPWEISEFLQGQPEDYEHPLLWSLFVCRDCYDYITCATREGRQDRLPGRTDRNQEACYGLDKWIGPEKFFLLKFSEPE